MKKRTKAFTLAEVLITLGIIGVVAAMTIPVLMNNIQDQQFKEAYKKAYSTASQAWLNAYTNGNIVPCTQWIDDATHTCNADNFNAFKNELKVSKDCGNNTASCWDMSGEMSWGGLFPSTSALAFIDASGMAWAKNNSPASPEVQIDINGNKGPNKYGKDRMILVFYYFSYDIIVNTYHYYANTQKILFYPDFPNSDPNVAADFPGNEQIYRCPSMNTHPCYYTSWITGGH